MKFMLVVILYKESIFESQTIKSLLKNEAILKSSQLIIYDNSPELQEFDATAFACQAEYVHDPRNLGVREGYEYALKKAQESQDEWIVLLDQDTQLPIHYFESLLEVTQDISNTCAVVVPKIIASNMWISPADNQNFKLDSSKLVSGIQENKVTGINSGACFSVRWLSENGGFNTEFPLDYLDHWLFYQVYKTGYKAYLMDVKVAHELSVFNYNNISQTRYESISKSEYLFYSNYRTDLFKTYKKHLILRFVKQLIVVKNKNIAKQTLKLIMLRKREEE